MPRKDPTHVSLWHPWQDRPGQRHKLALWEDFSFTGVNDAIEGIADGQFYVLVHDILDRIEIDPGILKDSRSTAYLSRSGNVSALQIKSKRKSGFLIPSIQWGSRTGPTRGLAERMQYVFQKFGFEALTPSSLSEKVLRSTLSDKLYFSRPSIPLRNSLIQNNKGGRIQHRNGSYTEGYENDISKAYLSIAARKEGVPDPRIAPIRFYHSDIWQDYPAAWMEVSMVCHRDKGIQPIQIKDKQSGEYRELYDGENFTSWLWSGEVRDCLNSGYDQLTPIQGWCFPFMSNFMRQWADILWDAYSGECDEFTKEIEKSMMVGLPGRFLKSPEKYTLVHYTESVKGDIPLIGKLDGVSSPMSEWCMRIEEDQDSAQLTPIGSFIVSECRRKLYHDSKEEEQAGNRVIRLYVDSFTTVSIPTTIKNGFRRGEYKTKHYTRVKIRHNRFIGYLDGDILVAKLPGTTGEKQRSLAIKEIASCYKEPP